MTVICKRRFYKIPTIFVSRNSIFSDIIKALLYALSPQRYAFIPFFYKEPRSLSMGFCKLIA